MSAPGRSRRRGRRPPRPASTCLLPSRLDLRPLAHVSQRSPTHFDAVLCLGSSLPHLLTQDDLGGGAAGHGRRTAERRGARPAKSKLRSALAEAAALVHGAGRRAGRAGGVGTALRRLRCSRGRIASTSSCFGRVSPTGWSRYTPPRTGRSSRPTCSTGWRSRLHRTARLWPNVAARRAIRCEPFGGSRGRGEEKMKAEGCSSPYPCILAA